MKSNKYKLLARILAVIGIVSVLMAFALVPASAFYDYESGSNYFPIFPLSYFNYSSDGVYRQPLYLNDVVVDFDYMLPELVYNDTIYTMSYPEEINMCNLSCFEIMLDSSADGGVYCSHIYLGYNNLSLGFDYHTANILGIDDYYRYLPSISLPRSDYFYSTGYYKGFYAKEDGGVATPVDFEFSTDFRNQIGVSNSCYLFKELIEYLPDFDYLYISEANFGFTPGASDPLTYTSYYFESYDGYRPFVDLSVLGYSSGDISALEAQIDELNEQLRESERVSSLQLNEIRDLKNENSTLQSNVDGLNSSIDVLMNRVDEQSELIIEQRFEISEKNELIHDQEVEIFELRNVNALDELFSGIAGAIWNGLDTIGDFGYSYVDGNNVRHNVTIGSLMTITVVGVVAFFVIRLIRGGR